MRGGSAAGVEILLPSVETSLASASFSLRHHAGYSFDREYCGIGNLLFHR